MRSPVLSLAVLAILAGVLLAGCAETDTDTNAPDSDEEGSIDRGHDGSSNGDTNAEEEAAPPTAERLEPEAEKPRTRAGETVTFEAHCRNPDENLAYATWAMKRPGAEAYETLTNDTAQFPDDPWGPKTESITFESEGEALVRWMCVTEAGHADMAWWTVSVEASEETDASNDTQDASGDTDHTADGNVTVHFVDVGQGDGIVVHHPDHTAVYDTGRWQGDSETAVRDHLQAEGADPDALVISHPDADHAGGCDIVLEAFAIESIYHPGLFKDTQTWQDCQDAMQAEGSPVHTDEGLDPGQSLDWTTTGTVELLHVDESASDANEGSIALELTRGDVELVLTGDIGCDTEETILDRELVDDPEIVQVAHHGSKYSTCNTWLEATRPEAGVISVGENNYGHPTDEVLDRLASHGVDTYRTDHHGTVEVTTDGTTWDVRTDAGGGPYEHDTSDGGGDSTNDTEDTSATEVSVTASVSDPEPCQYTDVTVYITAEDGEGNPVEDANTTSTWHYKSSSPTEEGTTNASGEDEHTRYISGATAGYEVIVDVEVDTGDAIGEAQTSFTPQEC